MVRARPLSFLKHYNSRILNPGGQNDQDPANAGVEANLDVQFAFGVSFPTPATAYTTAGSPPFIPDENTPTSKFLHDGAEQGID